VSAVTAPRPATTQVDAIVWHHHNRHSAVPSAKGSSAETVDTGDCPAGPAGVVAGHRLHPGGGGCPVKTRPLSDPALLLTGYAGRRPSVPPGEHPHRPAGGWCAPLVVHRPRRAGLLNATRMIVPCGRGSSRQGATVVFCSGLPVGRRGSAGLAGRVDAYHVLKGGSEAQPSHERVDVLGGQKTAAWRVGAHLKLEGDAHRGGLVHTGQHRTREGRPRHGGTVVFYRLPVVFYRLPVVLPAARCFYRPPGVTAVSGAADRSAPGSWPRELIESFR